MLSVTNFPNLLLWREATDRQNIMRCILLHLVVLTLAQAGTSTLRTGEIAKSLTAEDIAMIGEMVGERPWLVDGPRPLGPPSTSQTITAFFAPTMVTPTLRRGAFMIFSRDVNSGPWKGNGSARPYVQVAIPGRPFEEVLNDQDLNRPFRVIGAFPDEEVTELVTFIRSNPVVPAEQAPAGTKIGTLPITSIERRPDGSVNVSWMFAPSNHRQTAVLEKRGVDWVLLSVRRSIITVN